MERSGFYGFMLATILVAGAALEGCFSASKVGSKNGNQLTRANWMFKSLIGRGSATETSISLRFDEQNVMNGSDGCNYYRGGISFSGSTVHINGNIVTTRKVCKGPLASRVNAYIKALERVNSFVIKDDHLVLYDKCKVKIAVFKADLLWREKIRFDLHRVNADGLQGESDGLRALHYEYCIPDRPEAMKAVAAIDPTLEIHRGSPGRIGCYQGTLLCFGHTYQPDYNTVLKRLAMLVFIEEIREYFFE